MLDSPKMMKLEKNKRTAQKKPGTNPAAVYLVRHGQSAGNVAAERAEAEGLLHIEIKTRDVDVPLSELGRDQAQALGRWLSKQPAAKRPTVILCSPYLRAVETASIINEYLPRRGEKISIRLDERLREREFGIVDRMTKKGIESKYPYLAELYSLIGKFYFRPPGGESWCDVILRLRSVRDTLSIEYAGERVLIVCHSAVIMGWRYLLERMSEDEILTIDRESQVANCSLTSYLSFHSGRSSSSDRRDSKEMQFKLEKYNFVSPLLEAGEKVTRKSDVAIAPK